MVLREYLWGWFSKNLLVVAFFFSLLILATQLFSSLYLILSLPLGLGLLYLSMLFIYTYFIAFAFSILLVGGFLIYRLKEHRFFHTLYTFGFSDKKVFKTLWLQILFFCLLGVFGSLFVNYQKISHISKYLKFKFEEKLLITVPSQSFFSTDKLSFYFEKRTNEGFKNLIVRLGREVGAAQNARLSRNGILVLENATIFGERSGINYLMRSEIYKVSLVGKYHYTPPKKKFKKEAAFTVSVFTFPLLVFPLFFYTLLRFGRSRLSTALLGLLFVVFQFSVALLIKALV